MNRLKLLFLCLVTLLLSSCSSQVKDISVTSFRLVSIAPQGVGGITALVEVGIKNPSVGFEVTDVHAVVKMDGEEALTLTADQLMVPARSEKVYDIPLKGQIVEGFNPFQLLKLLSDSTASEKITISGSARLALRGGVGKNVDFHEKSFAELLEKTHQQR